MSNETKGPLPSEAALFPKVNIIIEIIWNIFPLDCRKRIVIQIHQRNNPIGVTLHRLLEDIPSVIECLVFLLAERLKKRPDFLARQCSHGETGLRAEELETLPKLQRIIIARLDELSHTER